MLIYLKAYNEPHNQLNKRVTVPPPGYSTKYQDKIHFGIFRYDSDGL